MIEKKNFIVILSQMCSEARAKVLSNTPDVTFDNPNLLKPAHLNKMANVQLYFICL